MDEVDREQHARHGEPAVQGGGLVLPAIGQYEPRRHGDGGYAEHRGRQRHESRACSRAIHVARPEGHEHAGDEDSGGDDADVPSIAEPGEVRLLPECGRERRDEDDDRSNCAENVGLRRRHSLGCEQQEAEHAGRRARG